MKSVTKIILLLSVCSFISCASAPKAADGPATVMTEEKKEKKEEKKEEKKAVKDMTNRERIYHARFSGAFYDKF